MNNILRNVFRVSLLVSGFFFFFMLDPAFAEDGGREWRPVYDIVLRWINFGILIFFLVKVVGPLLVKFLSGQQSEIRTKIERAQSEKDEMVAKVKEARESLENSGPRLEEIKTRIVEMGELRKQEIINDAKEQSQMMMKNARHRIDSLILHAKDDLKQEMMDMAMEKAFERLPAEITEEDNDHLIQKYLTAAAASS